MIEFLAHDLLAVVVDPGEHDRTGFLGAKLELNVRIGGDRGFEVGGEDLFAVHRAGELIQDLARDRVSAGILSLPGLHDVRHQGLDLDEVAFLRLFLVELDARLDIGHCNLSSERC